MGPVSNENTGNFSFYRGIHELLNPAIFVKNNGFFLYFSSVPELKC